MKYRLLLLLLLLLSLFSRVQLCATPQMAARQAPLSLGFSKQEYRSGLPFPSPMRESESEVAQLCPTLSDPMDCSLPVFSVHGIFQARVLEWDTIAFSGGIGYAHVNNLREQEPRIYSYIKMRYMSQVAVLQTKQERMH